MGAKYLNLIFLALVFMGCSMVVGLGCKKKNDSPDLPNYFMKATINGISFDSTCNVSIYGSHTLTIYGGNITLQILGTPQIGVSIPLDNLYENGYVTSPLPDKISLYGTLTIDSMSALIMTGTFSFTCTDSTKVTNGTFACAKPNSL